MLIFWLSVWIVVGCFVATWTYRAAYRVKPYWLHPCLPRPTFLRYQLLFPGYAFDGDDHQTVRNYSLFWRRGRWLELFGWGVIASLGPLRLVWAIVMYPITSLITLMTRPYHYPPTFH